MVGLHFISHGVAVRRALDDGRSVVVGRGPDCDIVLIGEDVLAAHVRLERVADCVHLTALDGARVLVNDAPATVAVLAAGDFLLVGETRIDVAPTGSNGPSRLAGLVPGPLAEETRGPSGGAAGGRRIFFDGDAPSELPDVAHEIRTLRLILEVNKRLARKEDEAGLLEEFLDAAIGLTGAERAFLLDGSKDAVEVVLSRTPSQEPVPGGDETLSRSLVRLVMRDRRAVVVDDLEREGPGPAPEGLALDPEDCRGARSVLCVPVPTDPPRCLYLDSRREEGLFARIDGDLFSAFGDQAALCIERVRLLAEHRAQAAELTEAGEREAGLNRRLSDLVVRRTAELREAREDLALVDVELRNRFTEIVGRGPAMLAMLRQVDRVAPTTVPVLFEGESGTGKELLARAIHQGSGRADARFVAENCAALPDTLLESELFGHERGAFTGADSASAGLFERADGGTLFLDEVGDMSPNLQKRLLRVLQEGEVRRVGGSEIRKVDTRIVTATNRDLDSLVRDGTFREDLYYRLAVVKIRVPPLRERREDVPDLVGHFLERVAEAGRSLPVVSQGALDAMVRYDWPGNVRQLENEIRRAVALSPGDIDLAALSRDVREGRPVIPDVLLDPSSFLEGRDLRGLVEELETRMVRGALEREGGNITRTAHRLGLSRLGLRKKMQRYGITKP